MWQCSVLLDVNVSSLFSLLSNTKRCKRRRTWIREVENNTGVWQTQWKEKEDETENEGEQSAPADPSHPDRRCLVIWAIKLVINDQTTKPWGPGRDVRKLSKMTSPQSFLWYFPAVFCLSFVSLQLSLSILVSWNSEPLLLGQSVLNHLSPPQPVGRLNRR